MESRGGFKDSHMPQATAGPSDGASTLDLTEGEGQILSARGHAAAGRYRGSTLEGTTADGNTLENFKDNRLERSC